MLNTEVKWNHNLNTILVEPTEEILGFEDYFMTSTPDGNFIIF